MRSTRKGLTRSQERFNKIDKKNQRETTKAEADLECCQHIRRRAKKELLFEKYYQGIALNSPS